MLDVVKLKSIMGWFDKSLMKILSFATTAVLNSLEPTSEKMLNSQYGYKYISAKSKLTILAAISILLKLIMK